MINGTAVSRDVTVLTNQMTGTCGNNVMASVTAGVITSAVIAAFVEK
jgi:hypothetical protein